MKKWWHDKIVYQIYPKSFKDDNNDGIGDLKGIISKLDYLAFLGVDILWLTPYFVSPMEDNGYDVANYYDINPIFGSMEDMDLLIKEAKKKNMYIMMDIVANHTSSEHTWFKEARSSKDNKYRDYYIWADEPLFNMQSCFGGSAWEYDSKTKQYYFHEFAKGQPDLNWENPKVREEMANVINFWLDKGIKGIRFDVIHLVGKEIKKNILAYGPTLHQKVHELYQNSFGKYDIITVGECWGDLPKAIDFTDPSHEELNMVFQFECTSFSATNTPYGKFSPRPMDFEFVKNTLIKYQHGLNDRSWNALCVENHDLGRAINRFGSLKYQKESAKAIATMNYLLKGTPFIYEGQEIGMINNTITDINDYDDVEVHGFYKELVLDKKVMSEEAFLDACNKEARDNNRSPMQWDNTVNAGFNKGHKTWIKMNESYHSINVKDEIDDENSILNYYKKLIKLRKSTDYKDVFVYGTFKEIDIDIKDLFAYIRSFEDKKIMVITNMKENIIEYHINEDVKKILLSNYNLDHIDKTINLRPYETIVIEI